MLTRRYLRRRGFEPTRDPAGFAYVPNPLTIHIRIFRRQRGRREQRGRVVAP